MTTRVTWRGKGRERAALVLLYGRVIRELINVRKPAGRTLFRSLIGPIRAVFSSRDFVGLRDGEDAGEELDEIVAKLWRNAAAICAVARLLPGWRQVAVCVCVICENCCPIRRPD